jgi:acyl-CoA reductase-like NAD-dependent aldehyde dehydrogenase
LGPVYEKGLAPLIEEGILRFAYGGRETGHFLTTHPEIDELHLTGSKGTYEAIVFGTEGGARERIEKNTPLNNKPITAELGNVSPVIVVPGKWSEKMIKIQAQELAAWTLLIAGYGCLTPRVIFTHKEWPLRERFLDELDKALRACPPKTLYYPGTKERINALEKASSDKMVKIDDKGTGELKCAHVFGLDPEKDDELHFRQEHFCPVLSEVPVSANSVEEFCEKSTSLANKQLWGTLNAYIMIDAEDEKKYGNAFSRMISDLDYGSILINMYAGFGHVLHCAPWGGAPGRKPDQIDSGTGWGNDPNMFGNPLKTVFKSPFKKLYDPMLHGAKNRVAFCHGLADYQFNPTVWSGLKLFALVGRSLV